MRKETIKYISNSLIWVLLALMPLLLMLVYNLHNNNLNLSDFISIFGDNNNLIYTTLNNVFGSSGSFPIANDNLIIYCSYLACITLLQIVVNIMLFIPKIALKWINNVMDKLGGKNDTL